MNCYKCSRIVLNVGGASSGVITSCFPSVFRVCRNEIMPGVISYYNCPGIKSCAPIANTWLFDFRGIFVLHDSDVECRNRVHNGLLHGRKWYNDGANEHSDPCGPCPINCGEWKLAKYSCRWRWKWNEWDGQSGWRRSYNGGIRWRRRWGRWGRWRRWGRGCFNRVCERRKLNKPTRG